jgi:hypothetical protein
MNDGLAELEEHRQPEHTGFCFFHVSVGGDGSDERDVIECNTRKAMLVGDP